MNKLLYGFIWKGNDKIKRTAPINDIENSGLKMLGYPINDFFRVIALKRFIEDHMYNSPWKSVLEMFLGDIGGKSILCCNFDTVPPFVRTQTVPESRAAKSCSLMSSQRMEHKNPTAFMQL